MADWSDLATELAVWDAARRPVTMWWRDDDARRPGPCLDRLLSISEDAGVPVHLAVIPDGLDPALVASLHGAPLAWVLQHGRSHRNYEPSGCHASEIGTHRELSRQVQDLRAGWCALQAARVPRLLPGLVPPWNRIAPETVAQLPRLGFRLLSTCFPRAVAYPVTGLLQVNIHVDPIHWKAGGGFRGQAWVLGAVIEHLQARRLGHVDAAEPTGLLTHHAQTDAATWAFVVQLLAFVQGRVRWIALREVLRHG
ncbi:MAG: polysaccharide deacetylase family protein [Pseudomonadota bacterium]